jgi:ABC-type amino acid transport substrate-binding protein
MSIARILQNLDLTALLERFLSLVREQYWLSVVLLFLVLAVLAVYAVVMVGSAFVHLRHLRRRLNHWYVLLPVVAAICALFGLSIATAAFLKTMPVASLSGIDPTISEHNTLQWKLPKSADSADLIFEVQRSPHPSFITAVERKFTKDNIMPLRSAEDGTFYWRVRAIELNAKTRAPGRFGAWSEPLKVEQYNSALERIRRRRIMTVAMENEFDQTDVRWFETESEWGTAAAEVGVGVKQTPMMATAVTWWERIAKWSKPLRWGEVPLVRSIIYRGVEVELAYKIADAICHRLFEGPNNTGDRGRERICLPSRDMGMNGSTSSKPNLCAQRECITIGVRFVGLKWNDVMRSIGDGVYDMAISTITYKPERESKYGILFGRQTYQLTDFGIVSRAENPVSATELKGKSVAVQQGTTSEDCMIALKKKFESEDDRVGINIVPQSTDKVTLTLLVENRGGFDVAVKDGTTADGWKLSMGSRISVDHTSAAIFGEGLPEFCRRQEYRIAFRAGDTELRDLTDGVIADLLRSGELGRIQKRAREDFTNFMRSGGANH